LPSFRAPVGALAHIALKFTEEIKLKVAAHGKTRIGKKVVLWPGAQTAHPNSVRKSHAALEHGMTPGQNRNGVVLVVEDVEETRDAIEHLLVATGYIVSTARDEAEAVFKARVQSPDLILMSLGLDAVEIAGMGRRIRENSWLTDGVPIVIFCVATLAEGADAEVGDNIYVTRPDNFDQLRRLLNRLVGRRQEAG
jgi:CheY-like chemotaxis protein